MSQTNQGNLLNTSNNSITANPLSDTFQNQKKIMGQSSNIKAESQRFNILIRIRPQIPHDLVELTTEEELKPCVFKKNEKKPEECVLYRRLSTAILTSNCIVLPELKLKRLASEILGYKLF